MTEGFEDFFERLILAFTQGEWLVDLERAKQEFYGSLGVGLDDSEGYESQMDLFFSWYLLNRRLEISGKTPLERLQSDEVKFVRREGDEALINSLLKREYSIYEILKLKGEQVFLKDLFSGDKKVVSFYGSSAGFEKGQYLSTWLWPKDEGTYYFGKGFCFHREETRKFLYKELKKLKKEVKGEKGLAFDQFFLATMRMKLKTDKYHHLRPQDIYTFSDRVKL